MFALAKHVLVVLPITADVMWVERAWLSGGPSAQVRLIEIHDHVQRPRRRQISIPCLRQYNAVQRDLRVPERFTTNSHDKHRMRIAAH